MNNLTKKQKEEKKSIFCKMLKNLISDLLNVKDKNYKSGEHLYGWIKMMKKIILPEKQNFDKDNVMYDLKVNPMDYFSCMFKITKLTELYGGNPYNLFPLRVSVIPRHIKLDTTTIVNILMECDKVYYKTHLVAESYNIWNKFFNLNLKVFRKKGYKFNDTIITDGVSCSILFVKEKYYHKMVPSINIKNLPNEKYIDDLTKEDYERLCDKKIIAIDPNKGDLIYSVDDVIKERNHYRYTQDQRRRETKSKKYQKIREKEKEQIIDGKKISEWESEISDYNRRTMNYEKYIEYLKEKNKLNNKLWEFYQKILFRKLNLNIYLNTLKSEQRLINKMKEIYGEPKEAIICIGDWDQKKQMKFKEPTKGKSFRELFRKNGYEVYLVDEFRTSCRCSICGGECETFRKMINPRPYRKGTTIVHGLLSCKNCKVLWNRDENSSNNIYMVARSSILGLDRPKHLQRDKN